MLRKRRIKKQVLFGLYAFILIGLISGTIYVGNSLSKKSEETASDNTYVSSIILSNSVPVVKETTNTLISPYTDASVIVGKDYYNYKGESADQEKEITYYNNSYIQNSGIDYTAEKQFDVISVLKGTVTEVKDDEILGKVVEIKHENNIITSYQSLSEVTVAKGDVIEQGHVIGKSGTNKIDESIGNHLHFELYYKGQVANPNDYLNKEISKEE